MNIVFNNLDFLKKKENILMFSIVSPEKQNS